jgi:phage terminase large subunit-like protein
MSIRALKSSAKNTLDSRKKSASVSFDLEKIDESFYADDTVLMEYQKEWILDETPVSIAEKSRQIGWSFIMALRAVLKAIEDKNDTVYTSYNKDSAKQFIKDCKKWSKIFNVVIKIIAQSNFIDDRDLCVFELNFTNGRSIIATAGNSENLRAKPGADIIIDEACYREESLEDIMAAGMATLIHGGSIRVGSTHAGLDTEFNALCKKVKAGETNYSHTKTTFREAVKQGLYKRICSKTGQEWTQEKEDKWIKEIYENYGVRAAEELDAEPCDFSGGGKVFNRKMFTRVHRDFHSETIYIRYYDLAATANDANAFYSATVKMAVDTDSGTLTICEFDALQLDPSEGTAFIRDTVKSDSEYVFHIIEQEPGSASIRYIEWLKQELQGYLIYGYQPKINKLMRAIPASNAVQQKEILIVDEDWTDEFIGIISKFDGTKKILVNDLVDCISGAYDWYKNGFNMMLS